MTNFTNEYDEKCIMQIGSKCYKHNKVISSNEIKPGKRCRWLEFKIFWNNVISRSLNIKRN